MRHLLSSTLKPTKLMRELLKHRKNVDETTRANELARRIVLGKKVIFYTDGSRRCEVVNDDEAFNSELLRLIHASLLIRQPVGDKRYCWVDASKNPVDIVIYGTRDFVKLASLEQPFTREQICQQLQTISKMK